MSRRQWNAERGSEAAVPRWAAGPTMRSIQASHAKSFTGEAIRLP